jgi:hypothetical protein
MDRTGLRIDYSAQLTGKRNADLGTWLRVSGVCMGLQKGGDLSLAGQVASHSAFLDVFSCSRRGIRVSFVLAKSLTNTPISHFTLS